MLNVCSPSADGAKRDCVGAGAHSQAAVILRRFRSIARALDSRPICQAFCGRDRRATSPASRRWRAMSAFAANFPCRRCFASVQYSFSNDGQNMVETLVLHVRDPKDLIQVSLEDSASSVTSSEAMLASNTPASRVRLERFGKSSVALARCSAAEAGPAPDQTAYEPLFRSASDSAGELSWLAGREKNRAGGTGEDQRAKPKPAPKIKAGPRRRQERDERNAVRTRAF